MSVSDFENDKSDEFGSLREPTAIHPWENELTPKSKILLDSNVAHYLISYKKLSEIDLFYNAIQRFQFIWAMDEYYDIWIAYEEIVDVDSTLSGHPRRRGCPSHPADEKKLGHPTLVNCGMARIAGELYLDEEESGDLVWMLNASSGRYCRKTPPSTLQCEAIQNRFHMIIGESVKWDDI